MNEKLNIQNLIELLAEKHGMDKADAESFVKEFFQLIEESLENDKYSGFAVHYMARSGGNSFRNVIHLRDHPP